MPLLMLIVNLRLPPPTTTERWWESTTLPRQEEGIPVNDGQAGRQAGRQVELN